MVSKAQSNYIRSLATATGRRDTGKFLVEGPKLAGEWLAHRPETIEMIVATQEWTEKAGLKKTGFQGSLHILPSERLQTMSQFKTASEVLLVAAIPAPTPLQKLGWSIVCETLQDPGNLGTILRIADWYGVAEVFTTTDSADFYNPKVVQAAMGAHLRLSLQKGSLAGYLEKEKRTVWAAALNGDSLYNVKPEKTGVLLIGNESKGLSDMAVQMAERRVTIPRKGGAESLNAAVAAGILCDRLVG